MYVCVEQPTASRIVDNALYGVASKPISVASYIYAEEAKDYSLVAEDQRLEKKVYSDAGECRWIDLE